MEEQTVTVRSFDYGNAVLLSVEDGDWGAKAVVIMVDQIDEAVEKLLNAKQQAAAARLKGGR